MSGYQNKRMSKTQANIPYGRARKKGLSNTHSLSKTQNPQNLAHANEELGLFNNSQLMYFLARHIIGNVCEITTLSNSKSVGVVKAVAPYGDLGLSYTRTAEIAKEDGPFLMEDSKQILLNDFKKLLLRNVRLGDCLKQDEKNDDCRDGDFTNNNDPGSCLKHYFTTPEDAEECSLDDRDSFPPNVMFAVNKEKFNVSSSFLPNLDGYTIPLDKSDPDYNLKEEHYAKLAQEIEEEGKHNRNALWENTGDEAMENCDELKYSAVLQEGVAGRELGSTAAPRGIRTARGYHRPLPNRDSVGELRRKTNEEKVVTSDTKATQPSSVFPSKPAVTEPTQVVGRPNGSQVKSPLNGAPAPDAELKTPVSDSLTPLPVTTDRTSEQPVLTEPSPKKEKKKYILDPNAPEFKPMGLPFPQFVDQTMQPLQSQSFSQAPVAMNPGFPQTLPCGPLSLAAFTVGHQPTVQNGQLYTAAAPFCLPSTVSYFASSMASQLPHNLRSAIQPGVCAPPQQMNVVPQAQQSAISTLSGVNSASAKGALRHVPVLPVTYARQRSTEHQVGQPITSTVSPFSIYPHHPMYSPQGNPPFPVIAAAPNHGQPGLHFIPTAAAGYPSTAYPTNSSAGVNISLTQSSGQPLISSQAFTPAQPMNLASNQGAQPIASVQPSQLQSLQLQQTYQQQTLSNMQTQYQQLAAYTAQYPGPPLLGAQHSPLPGAIGFYPHPLLQTQGILSLPVPQPPSGHQIQGANSTNTVTANQQPNQQYANTVQQQNGMQVPQIQQSPHMLFTSQPYPIQPNMFATPLLQAPNSAQQLPGQSFQLAAMAGAYPQNMQAGAGHLQHHPQHPVALYVPQQPQPPGGAN